MKDFKDSNTFKSLIKRWADQPDIEQYFKDKSTSFMTKLKNDVKSSSALKTKNKWNSLTPEQREEILLTVVDDPDTAMNYSSFEWDKLPDEITNIIPNLSENKQSNIKRTMNKESLKALIKECYLEVLKENDELPVDTGKNINMGMGSTEIGLDINKAKQGKISKLQMAIDELSKKIKYNLDLYKAGKMSVQDYKSAIGDSPAKLKSLAAALEAELTKAAKI